MKQIINAIKDTAKKFLSFLKRIGEKIQNTHTTVQIIAFSVCAAIFFLIFMSQVFHPASVRSLFFFPQAGTAKIRTEVRYLPKAHGMDERLDLYIDELLMGPIEPSLIRLYAKKVRVLRCFIRNKAAYIDLSSEALEVEGNLPSSIEAYALFKKNVFTNFRNLDMIYLYIDGIEVYSGNPD